MIDKNRPMPENIGKALGGRKYPFRDMEVGDSFLADGRVASMSGCKAYNAAIQFAYRTGMKFSGRKEGEGKVRIWRVE